MRQLMLTQEVPTIMVHETGENKGYGIGLKVINEFVQLHGGRFGVEPNSLQGSQFCFTVPLRHHPIQNPKSKIGYA